MAPSRPLTGSRRRAKPRKGKPSGSTSSLTNSTGFGLVPTAHVRPQPNIRGARRLPPSLRKGSVLALPFKMQWSQHGPLPLNGSKTGVDRLTQQQDTIRQDPNNLTQPMVADRDAFWTKQGDYDGYGDGMDIVMDNHERSSPAPQGSGDRHRRRREKQYTRWHQDIIPRLVRPYMEMRAGSDGGRTSASVGDLGWRGEGCTCGKKPRRLQVLLAEWTSLRMIEMWHCACHSASITLVRAGYFPCAPVQPSLAFHCDLLEFATLTMANTAPNIGGWSLSFEQFWMARGHMIGIRDRLRKRFSNAIQWYCVLIDAVEHHVADKVRGGSEDWWETKTPHHGSGMCDSANGMISAKTEDDFNMLEGVRGAPASKPTEEAATQPAPKVTPEAMHPYLRRTCPACFGGERPNLKTSSSHVLVCLDANFTQKCLRGKYDDPQLCHPQTHFINEAEVAEMERLVEDMRKKPQVSQRLKSTLPDEILDECEQSFAAAVEQVVKATKSLYADTGLMALLCRHDRVLWVVNITTPGERQFYAYALLQRLFNYLPSSWNVGLLYDIACQIQRSMIKHGILAQYYPRLHFAVSVFHAYGHQWACQLLYHPRKAPGFGLTDGEGCERLWSSLKRLIPSLRISGRWRRRWMLDRLIVHLKHDGLRLLGLWIARKRKACQKKLQEAETMLLAKGIQECDLRREWGDQIAVQTAKLHKHTQSAADKAIERILELRSHRDDQQEKLHLLRKQAEEVKVEQSDTWMALQEEIGTYEEASRSTARQIQAAEKSLGVNGRKRLDRLKGHKFLSIRMHARALKARIRAKIIAQKFEHDKLERAYRHHIMKDRDHQQTKKVLKRGQQSTANLVSRFNKLVEEMNDMKARGYALPRARIPMKLQMRMLYRLDIDDAVWNEDGLMEERFEDPPAWLGDQDTRDGIVALLQKDRVLEEIERLDAEENALMKWLRYEIMDVQTALVGDAGLSFQLKMRLKYLWNTSQHWRKHLDPEKREPWIWMTGNDFSEGDAPAALLYHTEHGEILGAQDDPEQGEAKTDEESEGGEESLGGTEEEVLLGELLDMTVIKDGDDVASDYASSSEAEPEGNTCHEAGWEHPVKQADTMEEVEAQLKQMQELLARVEGKKPIPRSRQRQNKTIGKRCGSWKCYTVDIEEARKRHGWFDGSVITVVAEAIWTQAGEAGRAHHTSSLGLYYIRRVLEAVEIDEVHEDKAWVLARIEELHKFSKRDVWLIPAHVPAHWTLVAIMWNKREIHFMDSLSDRPGAKNEIQVRDEVMAFLALADPENGQWTWVSEKRRARQHNGYDCGAFVLADMASYIITGQPSSKTQEDMGVWRQEIMQILDGLPDAVRTKTTTKATDEVLVIDD